MGLEHRDEGSLAGPEAGKRRLHGLTTDHQHLALDGARFEHRGLEVGMGAFHRGPGAQTRRVVFGPDLPEFGLRLVNGQSLFVLPVRGKDHAHLHRPPVGQRSAERVSARDHEVGLEVAPGQVDGQASPLHHGDGGAHFRAVAVGAGKQTVDRGNLDDATDQIPKPHSHLHRRAGGGRAQAVQFRDG